MSNSGESLTVTEMSDLREAIKAKYRTYQSLDRDRFPDFEYNSNRANYQPLKESFEVEFYEIRKIDRINNALHVPSTNTLALLFTNPDFIPGKKILNTCQSYAKGPSTLVANEANMGVAQAKPAISRNGALVLAGVVVGAALLIYQTTQQASPGSQLIIHRPYHDQIVPRQLLAEGRVTGLDTVWVVVRAIGRGQYWVQPPIGVEATGKWLGRIYIGSVDKGDIGVRSQIRAFGRPAIALQEGQILTSWPEADYASETIEVVRGTE
ncbi:hypothetical protein FAES_1292 [Fibrella aestuarina BUZ 2]|uniref:Uncharacterized protein n=1 Tax=Fibrella aestuarina BUZ 2 TaxID=1166018 RepID=I0K599_9BACT|nr:hypothetical protein [Fibrella aestuarina]CCG99302.1 hypothetical protein FAES_1292 [Fibrella aestuarina BUZ 2]